MGKFTSDAKELLAAIGGKENIAAVSHCITRMRYVLGDPKKADIKRIEAIKSVKGTFTQAGQFQVIIGNEVADFYKDFVDVSGVSGVSKAEVKSMSKQNQNILQRLMTSIAEIFAPLIPAIVVGGLILGFRNVIDSMEIFNGATLVSQSQFWAGVDHFLWLLGEAVFHVGIPVGICWTIMKKMGGTEMLGIILGLTLVSGQLTNAYAVAGALANGTINQWNFGFVKVNMIGYQAQVLPAMLAAFTLAYLERFFKKIIPQIVQMILVPFFSLLFAIMAAHFVGYIRLIPRSVRCNIRLLLCTARNHRPAPHEQRNRPSAHCRFRRDYVMAYDCVIEHSAGQCSARNDLPSAQKCKGKRTQHTLLHILLSWRN